MNSQPFSLVTPPSLVLMKTHLPYQAVAVAVTNVSPSKVECSASTLAGKRLELSKIDI